MSGMDPERLSLGGSSVVRAALDAERAEPGPDAERLRRIEAALEGSIPPGPLGGPGGPGASRGPWALGGLLGGVALVAIGLAVTPAPSPSAPREPARAPLTTTTPIATTAPPDSLAVEAVAPPAPPAPAPPRVSEPNAASTSGAPKSPAKIATGPATEGDELMLVGRAQDALHGRPAEALALCREHERGFPSGHFVQEREAIAIEALVYQKRIAEAERRWKSFERAYPTSSHRSHLAALFTPSVHANPGSATP